MSSQQRQGRLILDCIASDPTSSTSLYGIANAISGSSNEYTLLVKSNPDPSDVTALQWTVVSMVKLSETAYRHPTPGTVACAVSSEGVFTAFFYDINSRSMSGINSVAGPVLVPVGVRYDPQSGWKDIQGASQFFGHIKDPTRGLWTKYEQLVFYVPRAGGGEEVVLLLTDEYTSVVRFGVVDEATNTLQLAGVWKMKRDKTYEKGELSDPFDRTMFIIQPGVFPMMSYVDTRRFAYGDGNLYFTGMNFSHEQQRISSSLVIYPFASRDFAVKDPTPGVLPLPGPENYTHMHTFFGSQGGNRTYLGGIGYWDQQGKNEPIISGAATQMIQDPSNIHNSRMNLPPLPMLGEDRNSQKHFKLSMFQPVGLSTPFAVVPMTDGLYGVSLSASTATGTSSNLTGPVEVLIMTNEGVNTWPRVYDRQRDNSRSSDSTDKGSSVAAIISGLAVVVVGVGLFLRRRNRQLKARKEQTVDIELRDV